MSVSQFCFFVLPPDNVFVSCVCLKALLSAECVHFSNQSVGQRPSYTVDSESASGLMSFSTP